jgi:hypothetical protein
LVDCDIFSGDPILYAEDTLALPDVLPGFSIATSRLFGERATFDRNLVGHADSPE